MKISTIPGLCSIAGAIFWADRSAKDIDAARQEGNTEKEKALISEVCHGFAKRIMDKFNWTVDAEGTEKLPEDGPVVFISNHQSYADIVGLLSVAPFQCGFIAKSELKKIPHFAYWIERIRGLYIDRQDTRSSLRTIAEGAEFLKQGFSMAIFPEGTRSKGPDLGEFHAGSFKLASKARVPIVPVTIIDSYKLYEETGTIRKNASFKVIIHDPIDTAGLSRQELAELPERVREIIKSAL